LIESELKSKTQRLEQNSLTLEAKQKEWDDLKTLLKTAEGNLKSTQDTLKETEYVVEKQQSTEEKLFGEAEEVRDTLEANVLDTEQLHAKIDRKSTVETKNQEESQNFLAECSGRIATIEQQFAAFSQHQGDAYTTLQEVLETFVDGAKTDIKSLVQQSEQFAKQLGSDETALKDSYAEQHNAGVEVANAFGSQHSEQLSGSIASINSTGEELTQGFKTMQEQLLKQQKKVDTMGSLLQKMLHANGEAIACFSNENIASVKSLQQKLETYSNKQATHLQGHSNTLDAMMKNEVEEMQTGTKNVIDHSTSNLTASKSMLETQATTSLEIRNEMEQHKEKAAEEQNKSIKEAQALAELQTRDLMEQYKRGVSEARALAEKRVSKAKASRAAALEESQQMFTKQAELLAAAREMAERQTQLAMAAAEEAEAEAEALLCMQTEALDQTFTAAESKIKALAEKHVEQLQMEVDVTQQNFVRLENHQTESYQQTGSMLDQQQQTVATMANDNKQQQEKSLSTAVDSLKSSIAEQISRGKARHTELTAATTSLVSTVEEHQSSMAAGFKTDATRTEEAVGEVTVARAGMVQSMEVLDSTMASKMEGLAQSCQTHVASSTTFVEQCVARSEANLATHTAAVDTMTTHCNQHDASISQLASQMDNSSSSALESYQTSSSNILANNATEQQMLGEAHSEMRNLCTAFVGERMVVDMPTGATPQRKVLSYTKDFSRTGSLDDVRGEFRGNIMGDITEEMVEGEKEVAADVSEEPTVEATLTEETVEEEMPEKKLTRKRSSSKTSPVCNDKENIPVNEAKSTCTTGKKSKSKDDGTTGKKSGIVAPKMRGRPKLRNRN